MIHRRLQALIALAATSALTACAGGQPGTGGTTAADGGGDRIAVVASFYPLAYAAERVGGDRVEVTNLTGTGADPHHLELTPRQVGEVKDAALVLYSKGMQPATDTAIESASPARVLDLSSLATLPADVTQTIGEAAGHQSAGDDHTDDADHADHTDGADHADQGGHTQGDGHDHGASDPHFWLDPRAYSKAATMVADELAAADPAGAETYKANAAQFTAEIEKVDESFTRGLANCSQKNLVTGHTSFAYLAQRYGLNQVGVAGVLNDSEPDPARIARIVDFTKKNSVTTLYAEEGESTTVLDTVAREAGVETAPLDSLSLTKDGGYAARMEANLNTLRSGQRCS